MPAGLSTAIHSRVSRMMVSSGSSSAIVIRSRSLTSRDATATGRSLTSTRFCPINSRALRREISGCRAAMA